MCVRPRILCTTLQRWRIRCATSGDDVMIANSWMQWCLYWWRTVSWWLSCLNRGHGRAENASGKILFRRYYEIMQKVMNIEASRVVVGQSQKSYDSSDEIQRIPDHLPCFGKMECEMNISQRDEEQAEERQVQTEFYMTPWPFIRTCRNQRYCESAGKKRTGKIIRQRGEEWNSIKADFVVSSPQLLKRSYISMFCR